jgi:thymidylate kinase
MAIAKRAPQRVVAVDAADPIPKVHKKIVGIVEERLFSEKPLSKQKML